MDDELSPLVRAAAPRPRRFVAVLGATAVFAACLGARRVSLRKAELRSWSYCDEYGCVEGASSDGAPVSYTHLTLPTTPYV